METRESNEPYLSSAIAKIHSLVESIVAAGFPRNRIVIAGFSQGACLATEYVFRHPAHYAGLIAFTGGLIGPPNSVRVSTADHSGQLLGGVPALLCSGDPDPHVPWGRVQESADVLTAMGASVELRRFPGRAHTVSPEELTLANQMLVKLLLRTPA
jgi:predicted esterase